MPHSKLNLLHREADRVRPMVPAAKNGPSGTRWGTLVPNQGGGRRTGKAQANELLIIGDLFTLEVVQLQIKAVNSVHLRGTSRSMTLWLRRDAIP